MTFHQHKFAEQERKRKVGPVGGTGLMGGPGQTAEDRVGALEGSVSVPLTKYEVFKGPIRVN